MNAPLLTQIGLVGLVEEAWIETLATVDPEEIMFVDFVSEGRLLARQLKQEVQECPLSLLLSSKYSSLKARSHIRDTLSRH